MRCISCLFLLLIIAASQPVFANDWMKKDPEVMAAESRKFAADLRKEAGYFQANALEAGRSLSEDEQKYLSYTIQEAEFLEKSCEAWGKNQKRMAEKYQEKAGEFCQKRGELAKKLKLWEKKPENPAPPTDIKKNDAASDKAAKLAEIERQQAELERKKKELESGD